MSNPRPPASERLPLLAEAFPQTFFADPKQVQPLKINIHQDLYAALPAGVEQCQAQRFLYWYVNRAAYQKALLQGKGRLDLTGAVVDHDIPAAVREQAWERWQQLQATRKNATSPAEAVPVPATTTAADPDPARRKPVLSLKNRQATS